MCISNSVKRQSVIGFVVEASFGNFAYLHNSFTVGELFSLTVSQFSWHCNQNKRKNADKNGRVFVFFFLINSQQECFTRINQLLTRKLIRVLFSLKATRKWGRNFYICMLPCFNDLFSPSCYELSKKSFQIKTTNYRNHML